MFKGEHPLAHAFPWCSKTPFRYLIWYALMAYEKRSTYLAVLVAALGYFVDVYDLVLFSVVRVPSLKGLGLSDAEVFSTGVMLLNAQMVGMLFGGVLFGVLGDRRGRLSVLFGSIILYSVANLLNSAVSGVYSYLVLRFLAGVGLAGELGAGITLVAEILPREKRGYGTTIVATVGVLGAVLAGYAGTYLSWRVAYLLGGILGLLLLGLRVSVSESGLFQELNTRTARPGDLRLLFSSKDRIVRYFSCIIVGTPIWFIIGVLVTFSPEIGAHLGIASPISAGIAIQYAYLGLVFGDLTSGLLSQKLQSRKRAIGLFLALSTIAIACYLSPLNNAPERLYLLCLPLGFAAGYWAVLVTTAAELFGTNLRATVATSVPNFIRGATPLLTILFQTLNPSLGISGSAAAVAILTISAALLSLLNLRETFHADLNFIESSTS